MKRIVILGAGSGGTIMANKLRKDLDDNWSIVVIARDNVHDYQPGYLFVPFGINKPREIRRSRREFLKPGIDFVVSELTNVDWDKQEIQTATEGKFRYDILVMATGCDIKADEIPGLAESWGNDIQGFYRYDDCIDMGKKLRDFKGGRLVLNIAEMPIKCPVAPLEFVFLADWYFTERGMRDDVQIDFVTPLAGAFTKPVATRVLTDACKEKNINIIPNFALESVDASKKSIASYDGKEVEYDLLVSVPPNFGADVMIDSGISDPMGYIEVDKHTLQPAGYDNVWALGDGTNVPTSKAGAVAHFQADVIHENILSYIDGAEQHAKSDGHAV